MVDPFGMLASVGLPDRARRFNPLAEMRLDDLDIVEQIGQLADALVVQERRGNAFFADSARDLLAGLITHVLTEHMPDEERTLGTVRRLLTGLGNVDDNGNPISPTLGLMRMNERAGGLAMTAAGMLDNLSDRTRGDVIGTAMQQTRWLDSEAMRRCLAASEFSLAGLKRKPTTVYLVLPPQYLEEHARFLRLFINLSIRVASQGGKPRHGFLFVLDEFYALGAMPLLGKAAGLLAGFGAAVLLLGALGGGYLWGRSTEAAEVREVSGVIRAALTNGSASAQAWADAIRHNDLVGLLGRCEGRAVWADAGGRRACAVPLWLEDAPSSGAPAAPRS